MIDISSGSSKEIINNIKNIEYELFKFNRNFFFKDRWLVFNKIDKINIGCSKKFMYSLLKKINKNKYRRICFLSSKKKAGIDYMKNSTKNHVKYDHGIF